MTAFLVGLGFSLVCAALYRYLVWLNRQEPPQGGAGIRSGRAA